MTEPVHPAGAGPAPTPGDDGAVAPAARLDCRVDARDVRLDMTVPHGSHVALIGANGSGKSTALALLSGHLRPDAGEIHLDGMVVSSRRLHLPAHRRRVASLDQRPRLFPHLTAAANVAFGPRSRGLSRSRALERARTELESVGCAHLAERKPHQLSGGQAQRVAIARALAIDPELVLLDEPLSALDVEVAPEIRTLLAERLANRSVLLVSHDPLDLWSLARYIVVLDQGRIAQSGPVEEVLSRPVTDFSARMAGVSLLRGQAINEIHLGHASDTVALRTPGGDVVTGIRSTGLQWMTHEPAAAVVSPRDIEVYLPEACTAATAWNDWLATIVSLTPAGSVTLVSAALRDGQRVEVSVPSRRAAELSLSPGLPIHLGVRSADVAMYLRELFI